MSRPTRPAPQRGAAGPPRAFLALFVLALLAPAISAAPVMAGPTTPCTSEANHTSRAVRGLDRAEWALRARLASVESCVPASLDLQVVHELANLELARAAMREGGATQASVPSPQGPAAAVSELATRSGVLLTPAQERGIGALDSTPEPLRTSLGGFLGAFLAFDEAARATFGDVGTARTRTVGAPLHGVPTLGPLLEARRSLLQAAATLSLGWIASAEAVPGGHVRIAGVVALDLEGTDDTYHDDYALMIDVGGDDTYLNNAGGAHLAPAALVDMAGNDRYVGGRDEGANGGAFLSAGFLLDEAGDDVYVAGEYGTNGGGWGGVGLLVDRSGDDSYSAGPRGTNGGAATDPARGVGTLIDLGGDDAYTAGGDGTNGGAAYGTGFLMDRHGNDVYAIVSDPIFDGGIGTNGGGARGVGLLVDQAGDDRYAARDSGANGGGDAAGLGFLIDDAGNDHYEATDLGTNGGGHTGGFGYLWDGAGDDTYVAGEQGTNGGGGAILDVVGVQVPLPGLGLLRDEGGRDTYRDALVDCSDCSVLPKGLAGAQVDA